MTAKKAKTEKEEAIKAKDSTQSELDDLLMVFGDLEEKVAKYKVSRHATPLLIIVLTHHVG